MSNLTFTGKFVKHYDEKQGTSKAGKDWQSIKFVLGTEDQYNPVMAFSTMKLINDIKSLREGQEVTVHYNIKCNEYNGNFYVSLDAWKMDGANAATPSPTYTAQPIKDDGTDLPF